MFPFLLLPRDIRDKIYAYLFEGPNGKKLLFSMPFSEHIIMQLVEPDSEQTLSPPLALRWAPGWSPSDGLPLFRTCKQIQSEASTSLYGQNWFSFDDEGPNSIIPPNNRSGIAHMYDFLRLIGVLNRKSIRLLGFCLSNWEYLLHPGDPRQGHAGLFRRGTLGGYLIDVFDLLSQGHSLKAISFMSKGDAKNQEALIHAFLRDIPNSILLQAMIKLTGSISLFVIGSRVSGLNVSKSTQEAYEALLSHFANPHEGRATLPEDGTTEQQTHDTSGTQIQLSRQHTELKKRIEERRETMAQWKKLQLWIAQEEEQGRQDEAKMKQFEESLEGFDQSFRDLNLTHGQSGA